ncbi:MAG: hypothetical protein K0U41_06700 [Gammaproteobacteria bacterium]|nr:hypothetical protein [Gammaproteobacteria bacterium]
MTKSKGRIIPNEMELKPYTYKVLNPTHIINPNDHPLQDLLELAAGVQTLKDAILLAIQVSGNDDGGRQSGPTFESANDYEIYRNTLENTGDALANAHAEFSRVAGHITKLQQEVQYYKDVCKKFNLLLNNAFDKPWNPND